MKIGIDCSPIFLNQRAGVGNYCFNLVDALSKIDKEDSFFLYPVFYNNFPFVFKKDLPKSENFKILSMHMPIGILKFLWKYMPDMFKEYMLGSVDIVHSTTFTSPNFRDKRKRLVTTIYDLTFLTHPECHTKANIDHCLKGTKDAIKYADAIIAISNHTKKDLINFLKAPEELITVIHLAAGPEYYLVDDIGVLESVKKKYNLPMNYILFVGSLEPRKNIRALFKAYANLPDRLKKKFYLVIAGARGWLNSDIPETVKDLKIENGVRFVGFIAKDDIAAVYSQASVFVYPSLYEGFGLPILEAMSCGVPVITSNTSSMPEVAGDAAKLVTPTDERELSEALEYVLESKEVRKEMSLMGLKHVEGFSWEKCARETLEVYRKVTGD